LLLASGDRGDGKDQSAYIERDAEAVTETAQEVVPICGA
jgi:hypothetical protein